MLSKLTHIVGIFAASVMLLAACGGEEINLGNCPPNSAAQQQRGEDTVRFACTNWCHTESRVGEARDGAPVGMDFDTREQMLSWAKPIWKSILPTQNVMPPGGGLSGNQTEDVRVLLACGVE